MMFLQDAEKVRQRRSRLLEILNVPQRYASGFDSPAALLDSLFEHPARCSLHVRRCEPVRI